jgi:hypothetical protein
MNNQSVWQDMLGPDREIGRLVAQYNDTHRVYVSSIKADYPPGHYLVPNAAIVPWLGMYTLPLIEARDTEIILTQSDGYDVAAIKRIYKNAEVKAIFGPDHGAPQVYSVTIPAQDIVAARGVHATLYPADPGKAPVEQTLDSLAFDAAGGAGPGGQMARVRLAATLKVDTFGLYTFALAGETEPVPAGSIMVDGFDVSARTSITLGMGLHSVVVNDTPASSGSQPTRVELQWSSGQGTGMQVISSALLFDPRKVEPRGLTGLFREGATFDTTPAQGRVDPTISFYFHLTPLVRPYTADWSGKLYAPVDGTYTFQTEQISHSRLYIDGQQLIVNEANNNAVSAQTNLSKGLHDIRLQYEDYESFSHVYLFWTPPGYSDRYIIPSAFLLPVMGSYPDQPESGNWPSLEVADDTDWTRAGDQGSSGQPEGGTDSPGIQPTAVAAQPTATLQQAEQPTPIPPAPGQTQAQDIKPIMVLGQTGETLERPKAGAVDDAGNIYIYTEADTSIHKFGADGKPQNKWIVQEADGTAANEVSALVIKDGKLLALDAATSEIISYGFDGSGGERTKLCNCFFPRGMALSSDGNFWVADTGGSKVIKVNMDGTILASIEGKGDVLGTFMEPSGVWEGADGTLYVADIGNARVQRFNSDMKPFKAWSMGASVARDGNRITGDENGELVTEAESRAVVRYDPEGKELGRWTYQGAAGQATPSVITPAGDGKYLVLYPTDNLALLFTPGN